LIELKHEEIGVVNLESGTSPEEDGVEEEVVFSKKLYGAYGIVLLQFARLAKLSLPANIIIILRHPRLFR
jgi:hypothetical protein